MFKRNIFKILAVVFFLLAGASFYNPNKNKPIQPFDSAQGKPTQLIKMSPTNSARLNLIPSDSIQFYPTATTEPTPTNIPTSIIKGSDNPTPTDIISSPPQQDIINLEINGSEGKNKFTLNYKDGTNPCSILNDAKNDGKIRSLTILHYGAPLNSDYVKEINGFSDNWNFSIDGSGKPSGCSNYILNKNSTVTWKYN
jgi:hypothetical protein